MSVAVPAGLDDFPSFDLSLELFGAHWHGDRTERDACIAEDNETQLLVWDRTGADLALVERLQGARTAPPPAWWALTWMPGSLTAARATHKRAVA